MEIINARCRKIREEDLAILMEWRMMPEITRYMNTDPKLTMEGQISWLDRIRQEEKKNLLDGRRNFYWILEVDNEAAGFMSLVNINMISRKLETGAYVAVKRKRSLRLAIDIQWNLYHYAFDVLNMHKVCEEVFAENEAVNKLLDICGSTREGILRDHILKNDSYHDVVVRGILKEEWDKKKVDLQYNKFDFE